MKHLVFYDGECGFCDQVVQFLLEKDQNQDFGFAPLQGSTAERELKNIPEEAKQADSVILLENYGTKDQKLYMLGKAGFRVMWLLGGRWKLLGWVNFFPACLYDWGYRMVARNRYRLFPQSCTVPTQEQKDRFLP